MSDSYDPTDCIPPGSSVHEIFQARILEWVAISSSRGVFLTQRSNPCLLHGQAGSLPLSCQGSLHHGYSSPKPQFQLCLLFCPAPTSNHLTHYVGFPSILRIWALLHILPYGRPLPLLVWTVAKGIWLGLHLFLHSLFFKDQNALVTALLNPFPHPQTHHHLPVASPVPLQSLQRPSRYYTEPVPLCHLLPRSALTTLASSSCSCPKPSAWNALNYMPGSLLHILQVFTQAPPSQRVFLTTLFKVETLPQSTPVHDFIFLVLKS